MLGIYIKLVENGRDIETVPEKFREQVREAVYGGADDE